MTAVFPTSDPLDGRRCRTRHLASLFAAVSVSLFLATPAYSGSALDDLIDTPGAVGDAAREYAETPHYSPALQKRITREEADEALLRAMVPNKVKVNKTVTWEIPGGGSVMAKEGSILSYGYVRDGDYFIIYENIPLLRLSVSDGTPIKPDPTEVANAQRRVKLLNEEERTQMLDDQLSEMNQTLRELRDIADSRR